MLTVTVTKAGRGRAMAAAAMTWVRSAGRRRTSAAPAIAAPSVESSVPPTGAVTLDSIADRPAPMSYSLISW